MAFVLIAADLGEDGASTNLLLSAAMSETETLDVMNRLLATLYRSMPMYLHQADPWYDREHQDAATALANIVADQQAMSRRVAEFILDRGGQPEPGVYPLEFSDANLHFVSLEYLLQDLVRHQAADIERITRLVGELNSDASARTLAEEALGAARAHLDSLEALTNPEADEA